MVLEYAHLLIGIIWKITSWGQCRCAYSSTMDPLGNIRHTQMGIGVMSFIWNATWWLIPLSNWVITPVINGISRVNPLITEVIIHLLSGMSHQVLPCRHLSAHVHLLSHLLAVRQVRIMHVENDVPCTLPILDTLQKNDELLVSRYSRWYQKTKGLKYPSKIDLGIDLNIKHSTPMFFVEWSDTKIWSDVSHGQYSLYGWWSSHP